MGDRIKRDKDTVEIMIGIYCRSNHGTKENLCALCEELKNHAYKRLDRCKYGDHKPVCGKCKIHCYRPDMRDKVKTVMRKSGPIMLFKHPIITLYHFINGFRNNT